MPPADLMPEWHDMQGLVLSPYTHLEESTYLLFQINDRYAAEAQRWLRALLPQITPVEKRVRREDYPDVNVNLALTYSGLKKLGACMGQRPIGFSRAFVEGIDGSEHRCRILGDVDRGASIDWEWGGNPRPVDVLLMVFARSDALLRHAVLSLHPHRRQMKRRACIWGTSRALLKDREHFGFVDGLSQPILAGSDDAERFPTSRHLTALGEFVLGYPNAASRTPQVPSLSRCADLGRNGSYLVLRQLEQRYFDFWDYCDEQAGHDPALSAHIAEKILGRRLDGTPLVPMTSHTNNEFGFAEDAHGYGCPMGSHIRRANPRDSFDDNNQPAQAAILTNTHRILRRGRAYGPPATRDHRDDERRGLMFLGLNASIEQQFEFIQQNWINSEEFLGVPGECDPLIGRRVAANGHRNSFTIPALPRPARLNQLRKFVRVRGGEYFFLPGMHALRELAQC
jgi:Dyp-type peroxidase family